MKASLFFLEQSYSVVCLFSRQHLSSHYSFLLHFVHLLLRRALMCGWLWSTTRRQPLSSYASLASRALDNDDDGWLLWWWRRCYNNSYNYEGSSLSTTLKRLVGATQALWDQVCPTPPMMISEGFVITIIITTTTIVIPTIILPSTHRPTGNLQHPTPKELGSPRLAVFGRVWWFWQLDWHSQGDDCDHEDEDADDNDEYDDDEGYDCDT